MLPDLLVGPLTRFGSANAPSFEKKYYASHDSIYVSKH